MSQTAHDVLEKSKMNNKKKHRRSRQKIPFFFIVSVILLLPISYLTWDLFFRPVIDYNNWEKSYDGISWYTTRYPYYTYDTITPNMYFKSNAFIPESLVNGELTVRFRGCIYNVSVNGRTAYLNPACSEALSSGPEIDERTIPLTGFANPGLNEFRFQFLERGGTIWFELGGGKENNLIRYALLILFVALFVKVVTGRQELVYAFLALSFIPLHMFIKYFPISWGFESLDYYSLEIKILLVVPCLMLCIPFTYGLIDRLLVVVCRLLLQAKGLLLSILKKHSNPLITRFPKLFYELSYFPRGLRYALMSAVSFLIFWYFRTRHSMGDQGFIGQLALSNNVHTFFSTSPLSAWFLTLTYSVLKSLGVQYNSYELTSMVSCMYGAIAIPVLWETCKELTGNWKRCLAAFTIVASSYFMVLFFGYIEFYPALLLWMILYVYVSLLYLNDKISIFFPSLFFALMFCTHLSSGFMAPTLLLLPILKIRKLWGAGFIRSYAVILFATCIPIALVLGHVIFVYKGVCNNFTTCVTSFSSSLKGSDSSFFRPDLLTTHFVEEMINEYVQVSPAALIILLFLLFNLRKIKLRDSKLVFLAAASFTFGMYTVLHYTGLGLPQDWDVLAPIGFPLTLLVSYALVSSSGGRSMRYYAAAAISVSFFIHTLPMILHDADMMSLLIDLEKVLPKVPFGK